MKKSEPLNPQNEFNHFLFVQNPTTDFQIHQKYRRTKETEEKTEPRSGKTCKKHIRSGNFHFQCQHVRSDEYEFAIATCMCRCKCILRVYAMQFCVKCNLLAWWSSTQTVFKICVELKNHRSMMNNRIFGVI